VNAPLGDPQKQEPLRRARVVEGYTREADRSQHLSLARSLGVEAVLVGEHELAALLRDARPSPAVLIASNLSLYAKAIRQGTRDVILIHTSDEAYDVAKAGVYLDRHVTLVIRNYHVFPLPVLLLSVVTWPFLVAHWVYAYWRRHAPLKDNLGHVKRVLLSRRYLLRQIRFAYLVWRMPGDVVYLPLNATEVCYAGTPPTDKTIAVSFAGSVHSAERVCARDAAAALGASHGYAGWGWHASDSLPPHEYFRLLSSSRFTLSPMGHVNLDCFRFYEAVMADSLPIVPRRSPFQPCGYLSRLYDVDPRLLITTFSVSRVTAVMTAIADDERPVLAQRIRRSVEARNAMARDALEEALRTRRE
jgi:hypothetical protein